MAATPSSSSRFLGGMEVPVIISDSLQWREITVPSSLPSSEEPFAPLTENAASCIFIEEDPPRFLMWRIHKDVPHAIELVEFSVCEEFPKAGVHFTFRDTLCPFAFICRNEIQSSSVHTYLLYTVTASGIAYLFRLRNLSSYISGSVFPQDELIEFDLQRQGSQSGKVTAIAATSGCLVVGRQDGSIGCYQLGILDQGSQGFMYELRDDVGIGRLWGYVGRGKVAGSVQSSVISEVHGKKLLFVFHVDGYFRVWDLIGRARLLSHHINLPELAGPSSRVWIGDVNYDTGTLFFAALYEGATDQISEMIVVHCLHISWGDKIILSLEMPMQPIPLEEGRMIDLKITSNKLWILKEDGSMFYDLFNADVTLEHTCSYSLQDTFVADQLFQGSENAVDGLLWSSFSILPSTKDPIIPFVSSIFLRRLLLPGVHQCAAMRATIENYKKRLLTDSEYQSLTGVALKKEICSIIESEGLSENLISIIYYWKNFCTHYFDYWRQNSIPYALFKDPSTGAIGLIRKNSVSLFRSSEDIELLIYGSFDEFGDFVNSGLTLPDDDLDCEILFEVLKCISSIDHQVGKSAAAVFYESLVDPSVVSSEDIIPRLLKVLETGYNSSIPAHFTSEFGIDAFRYRVLADHKSQREFAIEMLLSLHGIFNKATSWERVLNVIEEYVKYLVPVKGRDTESLDSIKSSETNALFTINVSLLVSATSQVARVMVESAFDVLLLLGYLVNSSGQIHMTRGDISRIQLHLIPMIQDILLQWLILHLVGTTPSESPVLEDFSSRLSSLHIGNKTEKRSWVERIGKHDFTLACIPLLDCPESFDGQGYLSSGSFPEPVTFINLVRKFSSWILLGKTGQEYLPFSSHAIQLATILLRHGQYAAVEILLVIIDAHLCKKKVSHSVQTADGEWCKCLLLLGFCLLVQAQCGLQGIPKERKIREALRCFFRAASGRGARPALNQVLQSLSFQTGLQSPAGTGSEATWKLQYYQWVMQIFEQYNMKEGACQFALAALENVDEFDGQNNDPSPEDAITIRGRLWANVFTFMLDLKNYTDAYCAMVSNPDEDSRDVCLRRFIIVLCEHGATKVLCDGKLPFVGLMEKVEQELIWKAERSEITAKPNTYKLLYAFHMYRQNWRRAASYMYRYCVRLKSEVSLKEHPEITSSLQERLSGLSAVINALHLVHPSYAWIDPQQESCVSPDQHSPNKKARKFTNENGTADVDEKPMKQQYCVDVEKLENEYVLTSAQFSLALVNVKFRLTGSQKNLEDLVDLLVQENLYDMAFTVTLKFRKGSQLKRELERIFTIISQNCCPTGNEGRMTQLLLTSFDDQMGYSDIEMRPPLYPMVKPNSQWETLELYLEKYKGLHPRLPFIVAETLLLTDPQIELPLWLVHMFKSGKGASCWGMTGQESDAASLFRLYVSYCRFTEATNLLLEYLESFASLRPADIINRKKMSAVWFPYTTIERLWCQLEDLRRSGHMVDQCDKLQKLLQGALLNHLKQIKVDSDDVLSSAQ